MADDLSDTVTFLFTDIEGSTKLWDRSREKMSVALRKHDEILRSAIREHNGSVFKTVGDAFCAAFSNAPDAVAGALAVQQHLANASWPADTAIAVREAIHTGSAEVRDGDYFGPPLNRVARLLSTAHGGQIVISLATAELTRDSMPRGSSLKDLGEHRLRDLFRPEHVFQLLAEGIKVDFPPLLSLDRMKTNLPLMATPFIGRDEELASIRSIIHQSDARLVTLIGSGGTGKSRLALQAAADELDAFSDGVYFVDLSVVSDPKAVGASITQALGIEVPKEIEAVDLLTRQLENRSCLIILDNFEHLEEAASVVSTLLGECAKLKFLVTSRSRLKVYGEREYPVPPFRIPDVVTPSEMLSQYDAVRLFIDRAQAVIPSFEITNDNAPAVAEICSRLGGLPLAIELAAARIRLLPPQALLARLKEGLGILAGGSRDLPKRQQTMRGAIEWSYRLLDADEALFYRRIGIFAGSWSIESAEEVCAGGCEGLETLGGDIFLLIESLLDKSLICRVDGTDVPRFTMLALLREYAHERLEESGEREKLAQVLLTLFHRRLDPAMGSKAGTDEWTRWIESFTGDEPNFRVAVEHAICSGNVNDFCDLLDNVSMVHTLWEAASSLSGWLTRALEQVPKDSDRLRGKVLAYISGWEAEIGCDLSGHSAGDEAPRLLRPYGDSKDLAYALRSLSFISMAQGERERAAALGKEALGMSRRLREPWGIGANCMVLGEKALMSGQLDQAWEHVKKGLQWIDSSHLRFSAPHIAAFTAIMYISTNDIERAGSLLRWALDRLRIYGYRGEVSISIHAAALLSSDNIQAAKLYGFAIEHMGALKPYIEDQPVFSENFRQLETRLHNSLNETEFHKFAEAGKGMAVDSVFAIAHSIVDRCLAVL